MKFYLNHSLCAFAEDMKFEVDDSVASPASFFWKSYFKSEYRLPIGITPISVLARISSFGFLPNQIR